MWNTIWGFLTLMFFLRSLRSKKKQTHTQTRFTQTVRECWWELVTNLQGTAICTFKGTEAQPQAADDTPMEKGDMNVDSWPPKLTHSVGDYSQIVGMDQNPRNTYIYIWIIWRFPKIPKNQITPSPPSHGWPWFRCWTSRPRPRRPFGGQCRWGQGQVFMGKT
jgi:hypothetical protein